MSRMLAVISGLGLALCAGLLTLAWWIGGDTVFHDPRSMQGLKPLIDMATHKEWRWAGGDTLALDTPMTVRYEPHGMGDGGKPAVTVTGPAETVKHVRYRDGRIGADVTPPPRAEEKIKAVVSGIPIRKFVVNGGENLELGHIDQEELSLYVNGGGTVSGDGKVDNLNLIMNGPGVAHLGDLSVGDAKVQLLGPGDVTLAPHGDLKLFIAGNAHVVLKTRPASIKRTVFGDSIIETPDGVEAVGPPARVARPATPPTAATPATPAAPVRVQVQRQVQVQVQSTGPTPATPPTPATSATPATPVPPEEIANNGSRSQDLGHIDQRRLTISVNGSGSVKAEGQVDELTVNVQHSGNANLGKLSARKVTVHIMGSGNATVAPAEEADIAIMGSGNVHLTTHPASIRRAIMGPGRVIEQR